MNIARLFSFTRFLENELRRERILRRRDQLKADRERQRLVDALMRASNKQAVFDRPQQDSQPIPTPVFGPTAIAMAEAQREREEQEKILERAASNNGHIQIPQIPNQ